MSTAVMADRKQMMRTADRLRSTDIVELFPGQPVLVISRAEHPTEAGHQRIIVLASVERERTITMHVVPDGTWYRVLLRGVHGRIDDRLRGEQ